MGWMFIGNSIVNRRGGGQSLSSYWTPQKLPTDLVLTVLSATSVKVDWTDPVDATSDGIKVYLDDVLKDTIAFGVETLTITGLTAGTTYDVDVKSYKGVNESTAISGSVTISTLLSNLVFALKWDGSQFINAVTGLAMVDHGSVVSDNPLVANTDRVGVFASASTKYLSTPDTPDLSVGDIDFTVALWVRVTTVASQQVLFGHYLSTGDQRSWNIQFNNKNIVFSISSLGTSGTYELISFENVALADTNYFIIAWHDATANTINIQLNNSTILSKGWANGVKDSSGDLTVGAMANPLLYADGKISDCMLWKRKLTDVEKAVLWGGGTGNSHPFNSYPSKIILMGDKSGGEDATVSQSVNTVLMAQSPHLIIGTGDYDGAVLTTDQLLTNLGCGMFASPGNHDDWVVGVRTGFNTWFSGGGYRKVNIPYVDFFIYDYYLKMDESGYYTLAEAEAITLAARQASTQGQWLINGLASSTAKWKVVVMHNPPWASPSDFATPNIINNALNMRWDWVGLGASLIVCGHFHFYERLLKATGSGNIPILLIGNTGTTDSLGWTSVDGDSQAIFNEVTDTDFEGGMLVVMTVTEDALTIDLSAIKADYSVVAGKDQLVLT